MPSKTTPKQNPFPLTQDEAALLRDFRACDAGFHQMLLNMMNRLALSQPARPKVKLALVKSSTENGGRHV